VARIEASVMVDRPAEAVYEFMIDLLNPPKHDQGIIDVREIPAGPLGAGTTLESK
jgi:uncharacterized membrane protein